MEILFITHKFPPSIGGMEKQSYELISGIRQHCKVHTIIQSPNESKVWFFINLKKRIKRVLKENPGIGVIHCNDGVCASFCAWLKGYTDIPVTATLHGLDIVFPNKLFQRIVIPRLRKFDRIFSVSQATAEACYERGFRREQVVVVLNGVDKVLAEKELNDFFIRRFLSEYEIDITNKRIILGVGRAVKRKGFSWFVREVLPGLDRNYLFIHVGRIMSGKSFSERFFRILPQNLRNQLELFLGYPSDSRELNQLKTSNGNWVSAGSVAYSDLCQLMKQADLLVMPNLKVPGDMEGFGLVALEAALSGTFVLASDLEGINSAITNEKNGRLIESGNISSWRENIPELLDDKDILTRRADKAQKYVLENFSWEKMVLNYFWEFQYLVSRYKETCIHTEPVIPGLGMEIFQPLSMN